MGKLLIMGLDLTFQLPLLLLLLVLLQTTATDAASSSTAYVTYATGLA